MTALRPHPPDRDTGDLPMPPHVLLSAVRHSHSRNRETQQETADVVVGLADRLPRGYRDLIYGDVRWQLSLPDGAHPMSDVWLPVLNALSRVEVPDA